MIKWHNVKIRLESNLGQISADNYVNNSLEEMQL